jgi:hypothetical protein
LSSVVVILGAARIFIVAPVPSVEGTAGLYRENRDPSLRRLRSSGQALVGSGRQPRRTQDDNRALLTMTKSMRRLAFVPLILGLSFDLQAQTVSPRRGVTAEDYFNFVFVADPRLSPYGSQVAYVSARLDKAKNRRISSVWIVATHGRSAPRMLLDETWSACAPMVADGKRAFTSGADD